jgi:hypothetical protein
MVDLPFPKIFIVISKTITVRFIVKGYYLDTSDTKRRGFSYGGEKGARQRGLDPPRNWVSQTKALLMAKISAKAIRKRVKLQPVKIVDEEPKDAVLD